MTRLTTEEIKLLNAKSLVNTLSEGSNARSHRTNQEVMSLLEEIDTLGFENSILMERLVCCLWRRGCTPAPDLIQAQVMKK
jgi:hypothetical protein